MKLELRALVTEECISALRKLRESQPPASLAFRFLRIWDAIEPVLRRYEEQRLALLKKYAQTDDGVTFAFKREDGTRDDEAIAAFIEEHEALLKEEIDLPPVRFTLEELERFSAGLTVAEYGAIRWMIDDREASNAG